MSSATMYESPAMSSIAFSIGSLGVTALLFRALITHLVPMWTDDQAATLTAASWFHFAMAGVTVAMLALTDNPMGKLKQPPRDGEKLTLVQRMIGQGMQVEARIAWVLQEIPTLLGMTAVLALEGATLEPKWCHLPQWLFVVHYVHRVFVYPIFTMKTNNTVPLGITLLANAYCCFNGRLQAGLTSLPCNAGESDPTVAFVGLAVFVAGMTVNVTHDRMLAGLRKSGKAAGGGYVIPRGGMFEYISAANLVGEMVEWTGYAVVCFAIYGPVGGLVGGAFAAYVYSNLAPRAVATHRWYNARFGDDYKKLRRSALIPGVF